MSSRLCRASVICFMLACCKRLASALTDEWTNGSRRLRLDLGSSMTYGATITQAVSNSREKSFRHSLWAMPQSDARSAAAAINDEPNPLSLSSVQSCHLRAHPGYQSLRVRASSPTMPPTKDTNVPTEYPVKLKAGSPVLKGLRPVKPDLQGRDPRLPPFYEYVGKHPLEPDVEGGGQIFVYPVDSSPKGKIVSNNFAKVMKVPAGCTGDGQGPSESQKIRIFS